MTTTTTDAPRAWIGCLGCYNDGRLVGEWMDADDAENLPERCPRCGAEEREVFDTDGPTLTRSANVSAWIDAARAWESFDDPEMVADYCEHLGKDITDDDAEIAATDAYIGEMSAADYAEELLEDGAFGDIPEAVRYYIDTDAIARDLEMGGDIFTTENGRLFRNI